MIPAGQLFGGAGAESGTIERPLDHLVACHRRIEARLDALERIAAHLDAAPEEALEAAAGCFRFFDTNGVLHTEDEEESLFPRLRKGLTAEELRFLDDLERGHVEAERIYAELKEAVAARSGARSRESAARLCSLYRAHIAAEDTVLIELGRRILKTAELAEISREMKRRRGLKVQAAAAAALRCAAW
ncbi:MAG: hemerythrin domain-containing protein [Bryobacteraceae bacterium]